MVGINDDLQIIVDFNEHVFGWCLFQIKVPLYHLLSILRHFSLVKFIDKYWVKFLSFVSDQCFPFACNLFLKSYIVDYFNIRSECLEIDDFNA